MREAVEPPQGRGAVVGPQMPPVQREVLLRVVGVPGPQWLPLLELPEVGAARIPMLLLGAVETLPRLL